MANPVRHPELLAPGRKPWDEAASDSRDECWRDGAGSRELPALDPLAASDLRDERRGAGVSVAINWTALWGRLPWVQRQRGESQT